MYMEEENSKGRKRRSYDGKKLGWLIYARKVLLRVVILLLVFRFVVGFSTVSGNSMNPSYTDGQRVIYLRYSGDPKRGQVVSVRVPSGEYYIKRVVAIRGDTVELRDGQVYINGIAEEGDYIVGESLSEEGSVRYPLTLESGQCFVLGDNREESIDSRAFGAVDRSQITGIILYPPR